MKQIFIFPFELDYEENKCIIKYIDQLKSENKKVILFSKLSITLLGKHFKKLKNCDYIIADYGATLYNSNKKLLKSFPISKETVRSIYNDFEYYDSKSAITETTIKNKTVKLEIVLSTPTLFGEFRRFLDSHYFKSLCIYSKSPEYLDIVDNSTNIKNIIEYILEIEHLKSENVAIVSNRYLEEYYVDKNIAECFKKQLDTKKYSYFKTFNQKEKNK